MAEKNSLLEKVLSLQDKFASLQNQLSDPAVMSDMKKYVQLNKDYKELEPIIKAGLEYKKWWRSSLPPRILWPMKR